MRCSATMIAPVRPTGSGLRSTRNETAPSPCPPDPPVIATHGAALDAVHEHSRATETDSELVPPSGPNVRGAGSKLGWHRAFDVGDEGAVRFVEPPHPSAAADSAATAIAVMKERARRTTGALCISADS
jgi:hypothetical protein